MTEYPIILVHGIAIREAWYIKAFGKIGKVLRQEGFDVTTAKTDAFGTIENNAETLKKCVLDVLERTGAEKVNLIGQSKGGIDSLYMIEHLGMKEKVATLTTLSTPHKGSLIATRIWNIPMWIKRILALLINGFYRLAGDKRPNSLKVCEQLKLIEDVSEVSVPEGIYCQSYSQRMKRARDCLFVAIPYLIYNKVDRGNHDGIVTVDSARFGIYRGDCFKESISHTQMVDFFARRKTRSVIFDFYIRLCRELGEMGY